mmetsp:Transcript_24987/g.80745  ORF Transcript_24987/g.80745 Transcript_24987/m.80745 type:complete len:224 (-) Transcript_24987:2674-3345(-)
MWPRWHRRLERIGRRYLARGDATRGGSRTRRVRSTTRARRGWASYCPRRRSMERSRHLIRRLSRAAGARRRGRRRGRVADCGARAWRMRGASSLRRAGRVAWAPPTGGRAQHQVSSRPTRPASTEPSVRAYFRRLHALSYRPPRRCRSRRCGGCHCRSRRRRHTAPLRPIGTELEAGLPHRRRGLPSTRTAVPAKRPPPPSTGGAAWPTRLRPGLRRRHRQLP